MWIYDLAFCCETGKKSQYRVAELGSLSSGAKMAMKIFVKRVNASFLRVIADFQN